MHLNGRLRGWRLEDYPFPHGAHRRAANQTKTTIEMKQPALLKTLWLPAAVCLAGMALSGEVRAAAVVTGNSAFNSTTNDYTYTYSVMNTGALEDLAIISVRAFSPLGVTSPFAPSGFSLTFDSSQGWANFIEDGSITTPQTFGPGSTVGPFSFTSTYGPGPASFLAYDAAGNEFTGQTTAPVPEPAGALLASLAAVGGFLRRRRSTLSA